jgi:1,4-alpha-glucan branching enzyme
MHMGLQKLVIELNKLYTIEEALYNSDFTNECFEWVDFGDYKQSVLFFIRKVKTKENQNTIVVACNFTPTPRYNYIIGVPYPGIWKEIFNSDAKEYGGSGHGNLGKVNAKKKESHSRPFSISITLPPLSVVFFKKHSHKPISDS